MKLLLKYNFAFFLSYLILAYTLRNFEAFFLFRTLKSLILLFVVFILPGINLTILLQYFLKIKFSNLEFLNLSFISSLLFLPFILSFEYFQFNILSPILPFLNSLIIFAILLLVVNYKKDLTKEYTNNLILNLRLYSKDFISSPFIFIITLYITIIAIITSAYFALPDLDPYYWISIYSKDLANSSLELLPGHRPLFSSLIYIFNQGADIDLYALFKYVFPFLTILIIFPAYLIANKLSLKIQKITILLIAFVNSSAFLYLQLPIPQSILLITVSYFTLFLIYAWLNNNKYFYIFSGIIAFFSYFYHEIGIIIFFTWFVIFLIFNKKQLANKIINNKLSSLLIITLLILNVLPAVKNAFTLSSTLIKESTLKVIQLKTNLLFPAKYTNVDGNAMGWGNAMGIAKYYIYYAGFFSIALLITFGFYYIKNQDFRIFSKKHILYRAELITIMALFLLFFSISEILPRLFSIALLPERSWNLVGFFSMPFLILIFYFFQDKRKIVYFIFLFSLLMNIGGALYVNNTKKYLITKEQLSSAQWIKDNLPKNRIVLSADNNKNLLSFHAQSEIILTSSDIYHKIESFELEISKINAPDINLKIHSKSYIDQLEEALASLKELKKPDDMPDKSKLLNIAEINIINSKSIIDSINISTSYSKERNTNIFIYYSNPHTKNPYIKRPYYNIDTLHKTKTDFIFDKYPEKFQRVYSEKNDEVIIWKIL